tara:strand:- start:146 stop:865 length:720 start_codon:yes stop_codon:yes gene_type:complete
MAVYRTKGDTNKKNFGKYRKQFTIEDEWKADGTEWANRDSENSWVERYKYESELVLKVIKENNCKTILELGSGPGKLSQLIQKDMELEYHLIDKPHAKKRFEKRNYKGIFFTKDLFNHFDTSALNDKYDLIIANDFLEHIANPSDLVSKCWDLCHKDSKFFVSVPNWRMEHNFIYKGLFDYDNFIHFMELHGFTAKTVVGSPLVTPYYKKLDSESALPDELLTSWNWYFNLTPRDENEK